MLFWELPEGRLVQTVEVPAPPPKSALVKMVYWPCAGTLAFPGPDGDLTLLGVEKQYVKNLKAHKGPFYAIALLGKNLMTAGLNDKCLKLWEIGPDRPVKEVQTGKAVISAAALGQTKVLLIDTEGAANIYTVEENQLNLIMQLPGRDYRMVFVPSSEKIKAADDRRRTEEVQRIMKEMQNSNGQMADGEIEEHHSQLVELGYEHLSLSFRSEQAEQKGNLTEALRFSVSLTKILPKDNPKICPSMERHANLLEMTWHLPEADAVYRQILNLDPNYQFLRFPTILQKFPKGLNEMPWIIEPEIGIRDIIESATTIGKRFRGRYVIRKQESIFCGRVLLRPETIIEKYEKVRQESRKGTLPPAMDEQVWWLSGRGHEQVRFIAFGKGATNSIPGLQFAAQIHCGDSDTVVIPVVLFDWCDGLTDESAEEGNKRALDTLTHIKNNELSNSFLGAVDGALQQALRRLINENRPEGRMCR